MVAELPFGIAIAALPDATRTELLEQVLGNGWIMILAVAVLISSGLLVGSVAHRLGVAE
jgi:putative effector of murein hydrolase